MAKGLLGCCLSLHEESRCVRGLREACGGRRQAAGGRYLVRAAPQRCTRRTQPARGGDRVRKPAEGGSAAHDSAGYKEALKALGKDAVERDMRIVEGVG